MKICPHDLATKETACADGMCPICLAAELTDAKERTKTAEERWRKNDARIGKLQESIKTARIELGTFERNFDKDALVRCDILLDAALKGSA